MERKIARGLDAIDTKTLKGSSEFKFSWVADNIGNSPFRVSIDGNPGLLEGTSKISRWSSADLGTM